MRIIAIIILVLAIGMAMAIPVFCDYQYENEEMRTFEGNIVALDQSRSTITVKGLTTISFNISPDTKLQKDVYDIKLSDISVGDYVTVSYRRASEASRVPSKVYSVVVQYKRGRGW